MFDFSEEIGLTWYLFKTNLAYVVLATLLHSEFLGALLQLRLSLLLQILDEIDAVVNVEAVFLPMVIVVAHFELTLSLPFVLGISDFDFELARLFECLLVLFQKLALLT